MKKFTLFFLLALSTTSAFANTTLFCSTAMGGYDEIQKFQIINFDEVRIGTRSLDSFCSTNQNVMECDFIADRLRGYSVKIDLSNGHGVITQNFRKSHPIFCHY